MLQTVTVSVPATSANLGPGYDSLGIAVELRDFITATITDEPNVVVNIVGQGAGELPTDAGHLVAKTIIETCATFGKPIVGLNIECKNAIPQGRGMGSSAAAIVAGLVIARELCQVSITEPELLQLATDIEGHPDNAAACLLGGLTIAWVDEDDHADAVAMNVNPEIVPVFGVPKGELSTHKARGLIPAQIPHKDAAFNAARSALLIAAIIGSPELLLEATQDRLHQQYRVEAYPESMELVAKLRSLGIAACISGAGPSVLALCTTQNAALAIEVVAEQGFSAVPVPVAEEGTIVLEQPA